MDPLTGIISAAVVSSIITGIVTRWFKLRESTLSEDDRLSNKFASLVAFKALDEKVTVNTTNLAKLETKVDALSQLIPNSENRVFDRLLNISTTIAKLEGRLEN